MSDRELAAEFRTRRRDVIRKSMPRGAPIPDGWREQPTRYKYTQWVVRKKDVSLQLEDDVWCLFYRMGMKRLSTRDFTIHLRTVKDPDTGLKREETKQLDLVAVRDNKVFVVECKSKTELGTKRLADCIRQLSDDRNAYARALTAVLGFSPRLVLVLATRGIAVDPLDLAKAREKGISLWSEVDVDAFAHLAESAGEGAMYQLYNIVLKGKKAHDMAVKVPALKASMGGHVYFSTVLSPEQLLNIAYVHRRTGRSTVADTADAYQRMLDQKRVDKIREFIEDRERPGFLPGSIILCFDKPVVSEPLVGQEKMDSLVDAAEPVALTLPAEYGSAWIIDGQHRLYGYANSELKYRESLPVVAFAGEDTSFQSKVFVDINQNQKAVEPNLLWDLYEDLYATSTNAKECQDRALSRIAKRLNRESRSPFEGRIFVPKEANKSAPLNIRAVCHTLRRHSLVHPDRGNLYHENWDVTVDYAAQRVAAFYRVFQDAMPDEWESGEQHFICTKAGFITLTGILADIVQENLPPAKLRSLPSFQREASRILAPLVRHLIEAEQSLIDEYRSTGGAEEGTRNLRARFTEMIEINSAFLRDFRDKNKEPELLESASILSYVRCDEGYELEFKGSIELRLDKYLATGSREKSGELAGEGVLKSIVGFLNGQGGQVVIGVLEERAMQAARPDLAEKCVPIDGKYLVGTQVEYPRDGADGYQRRLQELIRQRIGTNPLAAGLVTTRRLDVYEGMDFWVISVRRAGKRQYLDGERFYVRIGNETRELKGAQADDYWATRSR